MKPPRNPVYIEFKESSLHLLDREHGADFPIERQLNGRITPASSELLVNGLRGFFSRHGSSASREAVCAIPARGVTVRSLSIPAQTREEPGSLIAMQIEAQFPVSPGDLAWGFLPVNSARDGLQEYLIAAVKKEAVEDYSAILAGAGLKGRFVVAALARAAAYASNSHFLEIGADKSELTALGENSVPALRVLNWGGNQADVSGLVPLLPAGKPVVLGGTPTPSDTIVANLTELAPRLNIQALRLPGTGPGRSSATLGLKSLIESGRAPLFLEGSEPPARPMISAAQWKWAAAACALLLVSLSLRYAEAVIYRAGVSKKIGEINASREKLPSIERELGFLSYLNTNQPPYLDTVAVVSSAAPPGTRLEQLSIIRRGEVTLRGTIQDPQGPEKFRAKLVDSGFFSKVVVEEQTPNPQNRQQITFRMTALLKPEELRKPLPPEKPSTNQPGMRPGPPGRMPMPAGPPGMPGPFPPGFIPS